MKNILIGTFIGICVIAVLGFLYFRFGLAPVATASAPMPFEKQLAQMALNARVEKEMPKSVPIQMSEEDYVAGAHLYRTNCALCHGLPGQAESGISKGMFPKPPQLFKGHGVTDDPPGETYWKVANGIRLTGMPAYTGALNDKQMWQVSLLVAHADKLSAQVAANLQQPLQIR